MLLSSDDGGALVRLIAGDLAGHPGPGDTHTPITYAHATVSPGAQLTRAVEPRRSTRWRTCCSARATPATSGVRSADHDLVVFGPGDTLTLRAADHQDGPSPRSRCCCSAGSRSGEPIAHYGPFVMNTRDEILQAVDDFNAGRMGTIPAIDLGT